VSSWPSAKARRVLAALLHIGWQIKRQSGSHRTLARPNWPEALYPGWAYPVPASYFASH